MTTTTGAKTPDFQVRAQGKPERAQARPLHWGCDRRARQILMLLGEARKLLHEMK
jgi:hypothetical protein